jgi:hypothetical protein
LLLSKKFIVTRPVDMKRLLERRAVEKAWLLAQLSKSLSRAVLRRKLAVQYRGRRRSILPSLVVSAESIDWVYTVSSRNLLPKKVPTCHLEMSFWGPMATTGS